MRRAKLWPRAVAGLIGFGAALNPASAKIAEETCQSLRDAASSEGTQWFALDNQGMATALKHGAPAPYSRASLRKIVHVHTRGDTSSDATIVAIKIEFQPVVNAQNIDWMRAKNTYKKRAVGTTIKTFQDYHSGANQDYDLSTNFHLETGSVNRTIPLDTSDPPIRRRQFLYKIPADGKDRSYRAYLIPLESVNPLGTCVDFDPYLLEGSTKLKVEFVDLQEASDSGDYYARSIDIDVSP